MSGNEQKKVLVTGAGSGIGRVLIDVLCDAGYHAAAVVRKSQDVEAIRTARPDVSVFLCDLSKRDDIEAIGPKVLGEFGAPDILVNNAGYGMRASVEESSADALEEMYRVNVFAPLLLARFFIPKMREKGTGLILNVSSVTGILSAPFNGLYASTKHALEGYSDSMRMELEPFGIRVVLLQLGPVRTNFLATAGRRGEHALYNPQSPYAFAYNKTLRMTARLERQGLSAETVARSILGIIRNPKPRARYRLHWIARITPFLLFFMPSRIFDRLLQRQVGLR